MSKPTENKKNWCGVEDRVLTRSFQKGDINAFEILFKKHHASIYQLCYSILRNEAQVSDAVQDTFLAAFKGLKKFREQSNFKTWLYRICVNESLRHVNQVKKQYKIENKLQAEAPPLTLMILENQDFSPERILIDGQRKQYLEDAINQLSEHHRIVLHLHYQEDLGVQEIASVLDIPVGSVKSRLFGARGKLKDILQPLFPNRDGINILEGHV